MTAFWIIGGVVGCFALGILAWIANRNAPPK